MHYLLQILSGTRGRVIGTGPQQICLTVYNLSGTCGVFHHEGLSQTRIMRSKWLEDVIGSHNLRKTRHIVKPLCRSEKARRTKSKRAKQNHMLLCISEIRRAITAGSRQHCYIAVSGC